MTPSSVEQEIFYVFTSPLACGCTDPAPVPGLVTHGPAPAPHQCAQPVIRGAAPTPAREQRTPVRLLSPPYSSFHDRPFIFSAARGATAVFFLVSGIFRFAIGRGLVAVGTPLDSSSLAPPSPSATAARTFSFDVGLVTEDGVKIHAWLLTLAQWTPEYIKQRPVIVFFQENAGNMSFRLPFLRLMLRRLGCPVFAVSYRGYGFSEGRPNEQGLQKDAKATLNHLIQRKDINPDKIVIFGRSLGGAVAIHLTAACQDKRKDINPDKIVIFRRSLGGAVAIHLTAACQDKRKDINPDKIVIFGCSLGGAVAIHFTTACQDKIAALILENTFTAVEDMVGQIVPPLGLLIGSGRPLNFLDQVTSKLRGLPVPINRPSGDKM
eukprot:gene12313-15477_t